eukprot:CAMPEP_0172310990 /NCGR_PEP_ID=MMETSP1058-20130122/13615_1 /TAXON_ID=83371 /ORGANISM="Detonula confervacea, Strain CCMP 353" /LENGTH=209 /DNA_ID=CAMNT_0013024031 /DNA_START=6 /DNA_END=635 /DNA_ORIENTATION=-
MKPSAESIEEQIQWTSVESTMAQILTPTTHDKDQSTSAAQRDLVLLTDIAAETNRIRTSSRTITNSISNSIQNEKEALSNESNELSHQISVVQSLEEEISTLTRAQSSMVAKRREAEQSIPIHAAVASEQIDEREENQCRHIKKLPKIKQELTLHALMTNIKWDYNRTGGVLAGEVSIPGRSVHRRFVIEKDDLSEFDIAERLWGMIEG